MKGVINDTQPYVSGVQGFLKKWDRCIKHMKTRMKNIGILTLILMAEVNVFICGNSMLDKKYNVSFSRENYSDILIIIFDAGKYKGINLQIWFMAAFALFLFIYVHVFISQILESPRHRMIKLHRYGKDRYFMHCKKCAVVGNVCGIAMLLVGMVLVGKVLSMQGNAVSLEKNDMADVGLQLLKLFLIMELYGSFNIYYLLKTKSSYVLTFSIVIASLQLILEAFIGKIHIFTYAAPLENVYYISVLIIVNVIVNLSLRRSAKRISLC